jgi:lipopolysaccharide/colanic/teichoic acid biosynthesis glycosyltransferase/glycosyltransferase involved in cell wall biosynthesis
MSKPEYSIVVPAYQAADLVGDCVKALNMQSTPRGRYEIIVVDDGSTDETATAARQARADRVLVIPHQGRSAARNAGIEAAKGEIVLFTDADCEPAPDWIEQITHPLLDSEIAGVKGVYRTRQKELVARFAQLEYEDKYVRMAQRDRIDFVDTYSAAYRRDILLANGGFDPHLEVDEDQELSFRLARKGYQMVFAPQAIVYHRHVTSLREYWQRKFEIGYWKALLLNWHPERTLQDSHTPQILKLQIILLGFLGILLVPALFWTTGRWLVLATTVLFSVTTIPFLLRVTRRDVAVALASPFLIVWRASALGIGLAAGFLRFSRQTSPRRAPISGLNQVIKRTMDIAGSLVGLTLTAPLLPVLAIAIKLNSPGPVFFIQERAGKNGRPFQIVKLRTMVEDAESIRTGSEERAEPFSPKLHDDPRITRVGRLLRRTSLDEAPQFWNVLKGDMSLVGPRPEETQIVRAYSDWHRRRLAVKPGVTGPMQVNGRGDLDLDERVRLELEYIHNYSIWKDLVILARTVMTVISGRGAY